MYFFFLKRAGTPTSGPAEARFWGTPTGYLLWENYLGFAPRDKVVGLVASTVQDFYARLIGSAVLKYYRGGAGIDFFLPSITPRRPNGTQTTHL